eukprot:505985_1
MELVINGYLTPSNSISLYVPDDIMNLIIKFIGALFGLDTMSFFLHIESSSDKHTIRLFNLISNTQYNVNLKIFHENKNSYQYLSYSRGYCTINNTPLPHTLYNQLKNNYDNTNNWSMFIRIGGMKAYLDISDWGRHWRQTPSNDCHLTAFNSSLLRQHSHSNRSHTYTAYDFELPSFPEYCAYPSIVYNKYNNILYAVNEKKIYSLNMKYEKHSVKQSYWPRSWNIPIFSQQHSEQWNWKLVTDKLQYDRGTSTSCIVDNKYIAIIGGLMNGTLNNIYGELFALNCNKSIKIKKLIEKHELHSVCVYHKKLHKIVLFQNSNCNVYDINKDMWYNIERPIVAQRVFTLSKNVWV